MDGHPKFASDVLVPKAASHKLQNLSLSVTKLTGRTLIDFRTNLFHRTPM
jgi:hypothetical protein